MIRQALRRSIASILMPAFALILTACGGGGGGGVSSDTGGGTTNPPATTTSGSVGFAQPSYGYPENGGTARVYLTRTGGTSGALSVTWTTEDGTAVAGSDYEAGNGTVTWSDGDSAQKEIVVALSDDATPEENETFSVALGGDATGSLTVTVENDDFGPTTAHLDQINIRDLHEAGWTGEGVGVAVIDVGFRADHVAFERGVTAYAAHEGTADVSGNEAHGTHVAGLAVGEIVGSAPGSDAYLIKGNPQGWASVSTPDVIAGLDYATAQDVGVVSMSFSFMAGSADEADAMQRATDGGAVLVMSSGNDGVALSDTPYLNGLGDDPRFGGRLIAVGSVDSQNVIAGSSNTAGTVQRFLVAPGVSVNSSCYEAADYYCAMSGTSMATPIVAGAAAVIMQRYPNLTADEVADAMLESATDLGAAGWDSTYGYGLLNMQAAMAHAAIVSASK